jgi:hypothetical protein
MGRHGCAACGFATGSCVQPYVTLFLQEKLPSLVRPCFMDQALRCVGFVLLAQSLCPCGSFCLQETLPWSEEVLVSKSELEERRNHVAELEQQVAELTMQTEYQLRLKELHLQVRQRTAHLYTLSSCICTAWHANEEAGLAARIVHCQSWRPAGQQAALLHICAGTAGRCQHVQGSTACSYVMTRAAAAAAVFCRSA